MSDRREIATKVGQNELILRSILFHCDGETLRKCLLVNRRWHFITHIVIEMKMQMVHCIVPFFLDPLISVYEWRAEILNIQSPTVKRNHDEHVARKRKGPEAFETRFVSMLKRSFCRPHYVILMEGNNVKVGKRHGWTRNRVLNAIRPNLPHECTIIGIDAHYGILGEASETFLTQSKDPMALSYDINGIFGISGLVIPKYEGVTIKTFMPDDDESQFVVDSDVKAIIILSSNVGYTRRNYLSSWQANTIFDHYQGQLALGGAQINSKEIWRAPTTSYIANDEANFYLINGPPPYETKKNPKRKSPITIQFSGPNCKAACLTVNRTLPFHRDPRDKAMTDLAHIEASLQEFKSKLTFPTDSNDRYETIGFLFFDYDCYRTYTNYSREHNSGIDLFFKAFPKTLITGVFCRFNYEHNFVPGTNNPTTFDKTSKVDLLPIPYRGIASFVTINLKKHISM